MTLTYQIGVHSDDLVDLNGEHEDVSPGSGAHFILPSGEFVKVTADYGDGWEFTVELPDGTKVKACLEDCGCHND